MKILITGAEGLLGIKLSEILKKNNYNIIGTYYEKKLDEKNNFFLDIRNCDDVKKIINKNSPDVIIHTAAFTDVDGCEKNKKEAFNVNVIGTKNLVSCAEKLKIKFVHISTDYVFDGKKGYYKEEDDTNPISYYGKTKLESEKIVQESCSDFIIGRTSVIYGSNKKNFATWIISMLKNNKTINIVDDQFVSPTLNIDLSEQLIALIKKNVNGIYHTAGGEKISRYAFAIEIANSFNLDKKLINTAKMNDMNWVARRPIDSSLNVSKVSAFKKPYKVKKALDILNNDIRGDALIK